MAEPVAHPPARVLLVCMPYQSASLSSLAIALLASTLRERGVETEEAYLHFDFARLVGASAYADLVEGGTQQGLLGEMLFAEGFHGPSAEEGVEQRLGPCFGPPAQRSALLAEFRRICLARVEAARPDLVGFSTSCNQLLPSLWLARQIKDVWPGVRIVLGGSACSLPMGERISQSYDVVDHVVSGYGEAPLLELALGGPGAGQRLMVSERPVNMDALPLPDYSTYLQAAHAFTEDPHRVMLAFESSRGCWWGQKNHCTFCGLNRLEMAYNSKSSARVVKEVRTLWERYGKPLFATDSILSRAHLKEVMPELAAYESKPVLFYEVKANMTGREVMALHKANVAWVQPGIESLNSHLLALLKKGVKAIQNLALLKWCRELGISVSWNLLCGIPGETIEDYDAQLRLIERYPHLAPPQGMNPIRVDRFAPYFSAFEKYGWSALEPLEEYRFLHPSLSREELRDIAYHFDALGGSSVFNAYRDDVQASLVRWKRAHARGDGLFWDEPRGLILIRDGAVSLIEREEELAAVINASHELVALPALKALSAKAPSLVEELLDMGVLYQEDNRVVNLAVRVGLRSMGMAWQGAPSQPGA
ncbi:RiPP maturation radical SAM C-methyltransferase [Corallococcus caeni]|uniref:RiPP maturation radical SAM C-methyltransferase n=1 Tax=Corallococcus caeni TaxID=3082388 RepID=UPI00295802E3|nr:RiPP maturation radical SAM C-methyltransferase [Corallococcus sp. KH5-1]